MQNGTETLGLIDDALVRVRKETDALDAGFKRAGAELAKARQAQLETYARIARVRLEELERGELLSALDDTDHRVTQILAARRAAEESLGREIAAAEEKLAALERERAERQSEVTASAEALDAAEADAQRRLEADGEYRAKLASAAESDAVADQAEEKARAAHSDRVDKGRPYEDDPVFMYLWQRGFGTSDYRAGPLARLMDGWSARSIEYERARRNYWMLTAIPVRLGEHATRMREIAERDVDAARALERSAAESAGVPDRERELESAEQRLEEADRAIDEQEALLDTLVEKRAAFASGEDEFSAECTSVLADAFRREDLDALRKRVARTRSLEDDALIADLEALDDEIDRLEAERVQYRRMHQAQRERTLGLEDVRRRFKQSRYDDVHSAFKNGALIAMLLDRFVGGSVGADEIWNALRRQQRFRRIAADPRYGTGGFPRSGLPPPWRMPGGGGWKGGGFGRGGGFGGGGFGRGGGFGGGGFKTGGGF